MDILNGHFGHFEAWWTFWIKIKHLHLLVLFKMLIKLFVILSSSYMPEIIYSKTNKILEDLNFKPDWKLDLSHDFIMYCKGYFAEHGITFHIFQHTG